MWRKYALHGAGVLAFCFFYLGKNQTYIGNNDKQILKYSIYF